MKPLLYSVFISVILFSGLAIARLDLSTISNNINNSLKSPTQLDQVIALEEQAFTRFSDENNIVNKLRKQRLQIHLNYARFHIKNKVYHLADQEIQYARSILELPERDNAPGTIGTSVQL